MPAEIPRKSLKIHQLCQTEALNTQRYRRRRVEVAPSYGGRQGHNKPFKDLSCCTKLLSCFASSTTDKARCSIESPWLEVSRREPNGAHSSQLVYMHREQTVISVCMCATWLFRLFVLCISIFAFPWQNSRSRQGACDQFLIQPTAYPTYPFCARTDFCLCY